jgi:uncharacterized membrane-anchored protein YitT (DUF2179 family)
LVAAESVSCSSSSLSSYCYDAELLKDLRDLYQPFFHTIPMIALLIAPMFAAAGYSLIYLLLGGGLGGAFLIFIVAKMVGK